jgi:hypothetical protein
MANRREGCQFTNRKLDRGMARHDHDCHRRMPNRLISF